MSVKTRNPLYFIALMPPESIRKEVETFKKEIKAKHGIKHALKLPAHITLQIPFRISESELKILIERLDDFCLNHKAFLTKLNGFGRFSKQVIFIKVEEHEPYLTLHEELQQLILNFIDLKKHEIASKMHPHLTIATRDLKRTEFPAVWEDFKNRNYTASFLAQEISLFKHDGKNWKVIKKFSLQE